MLYVTTARHNVTYVNTTGYNYTLQVKILYLWIYWDSAKFEIYAHLSNNASEIVDYSSSYLYANLTSERSNINNITVKFNQGYFELKIHKTTGFNKYTWPLYNTCIRLKIGLEDDYGEVGFHIKVSDDISLAMTSDFYVKPEGILQFYCHEKDRDWIANIFRAISDIFGAWFGGLFSWIMYLSSLMWYMLPPEIRDLVVYVMTVANIIASIIVFVLQFSILGIELYIYLVFFEFVNLLLYVIDRMLEGRIEAIHLLAEFFHRQITLIMKIIQTIHAIVKTIIPI